MGYPLTTEVLAHSAIFVTTSPARTRRFDLRRLYTALALIPAVYIIIAHLAPWVLTLLLLVVGSIALLELYNLSFPSHVSRLLMGGGLAGFTLTLIHPHFSFSMQELLLGSVLLAAVIISISAASTEHRWNDAVVILLGVFYVGFPLSTVVSTRTLPGGEWLVLFLAVVTWASDTGAYYAGTLWGKHPLLPSISPKKTVEGVLGGLVLAVGVAFLAQQWFTSELSLADAVILGLLLTTVGLLGDLFESMIKRRTGVKDSGGILPGHGGMLDRLDSLLFTAPTFYYYVAYVRGLSPPS
ncbi:MAG: Phosphatidate cytidylyltransferase [Candidatus Nitrospira kreftii]|uniref:Phosphatidate cytidylyltransferase n=1 Tax=Candidatus Nitrospira kreftii TaxID=2652173 RepID=A0A7S8FFY1_9BACT|nr:MAG: Phosphatidate cytidylyltransferase [Candidatus Nitrospira kreftii]